MTEAEQNQYMPGTMTYHEQNEQPASSPPRSIFREHALQHYIQKNEQSVLPKTISPLVFACCWLFLFIAILSGFLVWSIPVPNYLDTLGMPISQGSSTSTTQTANILALFPLSAQPYIRSGQAVQVSGNTLKTPLAGHITHVNTRHLTLTELSQRYTLNPALLQSLPGDEVFVATVTTAQAIPLQDNLNNRVIIRYQQGSKQAFSLLLDLGNS